MTLKTDARFPFSRQGLEVVFTADFRLGSSIWLGGSTIDDIFYRIPQSNILLCAARHHSEFLYYLRRYFLQTVMMVCVRMKTSMRRVHYIEVSSLRNVRGSFRRLSVGVGSRFEEQSMPCERHPAIPTLQYIYNVCNRLRYCPAHALLLNILT